MADTTSIPTLRTERLILRPWREADLAPFATLNSDPIAMEYFPKLLTREESDAMVGRIRAHFDREGFGLWAVEVPGIAPFIGFTGLARPSFMSDSIEVGWRLMREHWGAGYATEAARASLAWGFANLPVPEIVAMVVPDNLRSQRVMAKLGMARDPGADFEHPNIRAGSPRRHHWLFRLQRPH